MLFCALVLFISCVGAFAQSFTFHLKAVDGLTQLGPVYLNGGIPTLTPTGAIPTFFISGAAFLVQFTASIAPHAFVNFLSSTGGTGAACDNTGSVSASVIFDVFSSNPCAAPSPFALTVGKQALTFGSGGTFLACGGLNLSTIAYSPNATIDILGCNRIQLLAFN